MARKKLTDLEKLERKRLQRKRSMQKAREKLKNDPVKLEERRLKDRQRYERNKQQGKVKSINDMTSREQRQVRKGWRKRAQKYRNKVNDIKKRDKVLEELSPPQTPVQNEQLIENTNSRKKAGAKLARKNRYMKSKKIKELEEKLKKATTKMNMYKQRLYRLNQKHVDSPNKTVNKILSGTKDYKEIRRKLLFGEILSRQIRDNFRQKKDKVNREKVRQTLTGKWVAKYKFLNQVRSFTSRRLLLNQRYTPSEKKEINRFLAQAKNDVTCFLERDESSRLTPGKKDTITRKKIKKQKRLLNNSLKNLHKMFISEYPSYSKMSYSLFCKLRPFWVIFPRAESRDTCVCKIHANTSFIVSKLKQLKIINSGTPDDVAKEICCTGDRMQQLCLERKCIQCKEKQITINEFNGNEMISYYKWVNKRVPVLIKGKEKLTMKTCKDTIECTKYELVHNLLDNIYSFMTHLSNILHQYTMIDRIKKNLSEEEVMLHCDFSENYNCKYSEEVQSMHFGGSRAQITLHTSVYYYKTKCDTELKHKNFCTLSECSRHDAAAICAHLCALIEDIRSVTPNIKRIHFLTDGPTTQYRNKYMFLLLATYIPVIFNVDEVNWHFSEAGHGKGAPDGIGGCLKRTADRFVSQGNDIENLEKFTATIKKSGIGINILIVKEESISEIDAIVSEVDLKTFKGTLKIHELSWTKKKPNQVFARILTCRDCKNGEDCSHYGMGIIEVPFLHQAQMSQEKLYEPCTSNVARTAPLTQSIEVRKFRYSDVYSSDSEESLGIGSEPLNSYTDNTFGLNIKHNDYIIVRLSAKKSVKHYIALVLNVDKYDELTVKFMKKCYKECFVFPSIDDIAQIDKSDVVGILEEPYLNKREQYIFCFQAKYQSLSIS